MFVKMCAHRLSKDAMSSRVGSVKHRPKRETPRNEDEDIVDNSDGDAMNNHIVPDIWTAKHFGRFRPELGMMDNNVPFKVSKKCEHQSPVISTIDCWFNEFVEGDDVEPYLDEIEATNNHC